MNLIKKMTPVAVATTLAVAAMAAVPGAANADVSASAAVANFYLWRGLDISAGAPQVSGSLDYSHDSGFYAGVWGSSEDAGTETDLYIGFGGELGGLSYDISAWDYLYPSDNALDGGSLEDSNASEAVLGLGYADVGLNIYFGNDKSGGDDYTYTTIDYSFSDFNVLYGMWAFDETTGADDSHLTFAYSANDQLTFTVSVGMQDDSATSGYDTDPLFHVSYSLPVKM